MIGVEDAWAAYQFDRATLSFAAWVERELERKRPLSMLLQTPNGHAPAAEFGNPRAVLERFGPIRRMKLPESGIW